MYSQNKGIGVYTRPEVAQKYPNFGQISLETTHSQLRETVTLPTLAKTRPLLYNWYAESTMISGGASEVICSGTPVLVGAGQPGTRLGILMKDATPGSTVEVMTSGLFYLPVDYLGDSGGTPRTASNLTGLNGKKAYYVVATGTVTDVKPTYADWSYLDIGYFEESAQIKPVNLLAGLWYAPVRLDPSLQLAKASDNNPALPGDASTAFSTTHYVSASISDFSGLTQTLSVVAANADPGAPVLPENITWTVEGTVLAEKGFEVDATFTAGAGKTVAVAVTRGGVTTTKNYTVTMSASAAPASWTEV